MCLEADRNVGGGFVLWHWYEKNHYHASADDPREVDVEARFGQHLPINLGSGSNAVGATTVRCLIRYSTICHSDNDCYNEQKKHNVFSVTQSLNEAH